MNQTLNHPEAKAEICFHEGWNLTPAGRSNPNEYWSHIHFDGDPKWGQELWTLFVELDKPPEPNQQVYLAKIFFLSPKAPSHFLRPGQKFELCIGKIVKAHGVIK
jgi:hypothetical protein